MAGTVKANIVQLGDSATATQNLTIRTNIDGSFTLARGNAGATTQDILTIDANGRIAYPQTVVACSVTQTVVQSVASATFVQMAFQNVEFDTAGSFNTATGKFQPTVPGYYQITASVGWNSGVALTQATTTIIKNATRFKDSIMGTGFVCEVSALIYMNGTTDFLTLQAYQASGAAVNTSAAINQTFFQAILIAKA